MSDVSEPLPLRAFKAWRENGTRFFVEYGLARVFAWPLHLYYRACARPGSFSLGGESYSYFYHGYNTTWVNERIVEVPIFTRIVERARGKRILEIGNVLKHYHPFTHDVLDKYEASPGVINADVVDFHPERPYELIVSVSTLEHVGFDERPPEPEKILRALSHLRERCLAPGGELIFSYPAGYNKTLDAAVNSGGLPWKERRCLRRVSRDNRWEECGWEETRGARYNSPFYFANVLAVATLGSSAPRQ